MKICFVQPDTDYQIEKNRHALAMTFPQLIVDLNIENSDYCIYVAGKSTISFYDFLKKMEPTHVFITSITSTFPYAIEFAYIAKQCKCITVLGGLFASINYKTIAKYFDCFDYIVSGHPNSSLLLRIKELPSTPQYIIYLGYSNYYKPLYDVITDNRFRSIYNYTDTVCYELANGCNYNCSFCTMRHAFPNHEIKRRSIDIIQHDINKLHLCWNKLKLIDDDISLSINILKELDFKDFKEVIAETRLDNITEKNMRIFQKVGITHLIVGVESFDKSFLTLSGKTRFAQSWNTYIKKVMNLCLKYNIIIRPVFMITNPNTTIESLTKCKKQMSDWIPENNVELLCSFYTPHPGMSEKNEYQNLLTHNLKYFDHLNCIWLPPLIKKNNIHELCEIYDDIVFITKSSEYNPKIKLTFDDDKKMDCFFR